jgi:hypothetical protein
MTAHFLIQEPFPMPSTTSTPSPLQRHTGQQADYSALLTQLQTMQTSPTPLNSAFLTPHIHSPLGLEHKQAQSLLQELHEDAGDPALSSQLQARAGQELLVSGNAQDCIFSTARYDGMVTTFTVNVAERSSRQIREFQQALMSIGGEIRSNGQFRVPQILKYYGLAMPPALKSSDLTRLIEEVQERRAIHRLNLELGLDISQLIAEPDQLALLNMISEIVTGDATSVIDSMASAVTPPITPLQLERQPTACLERLLDTPMARDLARRLLETLNWYGTGLDEETVPDIGARLVMEALCAWYDLSYADAPQSVAGYQVKQSTHHGQSYEHIRKDFLKHLVDSHRTTTATETALIGRLGLAKFPVEFQVRDIPNDLPYATSVVWVNFIHGCALAHTLEPGLLQRLNFQQLTDLPLKKSEHASGPMLNLIALTRAPAALEWAQATGAMVSDEGTADKQQALLNAMTALENHTRHLSDAIVQLGAELPQRLEVAQAQLKKKFGSKTDNLEKIRLMPYDGNPKARNKRSIIDTPEMAKKTWSMIEVYASRGFSSNKQWYFSEDGKLRNYWIWLDNDGELKRGYLREKGEHGYPLEPIPPRLKLPDFEKLFDAQFEDYLTKTRSAYQYLITSQLVTLSLPDRQALEHGEVRFFALKNETENSATNDEAAQTSLPLRARMGFVLQATYQTKVTYYECLPRAGVIRARTDISGESDDRDRYVTNQVNENDGDTPQVCGSGLPFDWQAHQSGTPPKTGTSCGATLEILGAALPPSQIFPAGHHRWPNLTLSSPRTLEIASFIAQNLFYVDEAKLRTEAWGEPTELERELDKEHWIHGFKEFVPFWGALEDLQSDSLGTRILGAIGLLVDIVSFAVPLGKFAAGSIRLAARAGRMGVRTTLPLMADVSKKLITSSLKNLNPLDGLPDLFRLTGRGLQNTGRAVLYLENKAMVRLKKISGRLEKYELINRLPQMTEPGHWKPLSGADQLAIVKGIEDVPVRNVDPSGSRYYLLDPLTSRPFGPQLTTQTHDLSLGRSSYSTVKKNDEQIVVELSENARANYILEIDGRTTILIDDVPYRLDGEELRRVDMTDDSGQWTLVPCRLPRVPGAQNDCRVSYVMGEPAPTPPIGTFDKTKGYAPWFGDRISAPGALPGHSGLFLAVDAKLYRIVDNKPTLFNGDMIRLGFRGGMLRPRQQIQATMQFRKGMYARLDVGGTYEGINDSHRVGAILVPAIDDSASHVFLRVNTQEYYLSTIPKGELPGDQLTFNRLTSAEMADGTLGAELLKVYTGSLNANTIVRIHGAETVARAMKTMEEIAIPLGTIANPSANMKWLKVDTSAGEALMFDHTTRVIVCRRAEGTTSWTRSKEAPQALRKKTAEIFDTLFLSPTINPVTANDALRIENSMQKLYKLLPRFERPLNARNIAYAEVTTVSGKREIYVSVSGARRTTTRLPLFRHLGANHVQIGGTTYINIDYSQTFPRTSLEVTAEGRLLAVPLTIKDIGKYQPSMPPRPTSLDSESKLINVIRDKYTDPTELRSVDIVTTMRPCESCSVVIKEFGHDGGADTLQVLWN